MRIALCQIDVGDDQDANLARVRDALASARGADLAVFPEATQVRFGNDLVAAAQPLDGEFTTGLRAAAGEAGIPLIAGVFEPSVDRKVYNTAVAIDAGGELAGTYRKIHLFDAFHHVESRTVAAGTTPTVVELAGHRIGLATCYDLRFPELFRALVDDGAELFAVIAAWAPGAMKEEHWITLARARAIENTMWTLAAAKALETSAPPSGGPTGIGRSLLVDPLGAIRSDLGPHPCVAVVDIDLDVTDQVRRVLPSLSHRRLGLPGRSLRRGTADVLLTTVVGQWNRLGLSPRGEYPCQSVAVVSTVAPWQPGTVAGIGHCRFRWERPPTLQACPETVGGTSNPPSFGVRPAADAVETQCATSSMSPATSPA